MTTLAAALHKLTTWRKLVCSNDNPYLGPKYAGRTTQGKVLRDHNEPAGTTAHTRTPLSVECPLCAQHCPELTFVLSQLILALAL